MTNLTVGSWWQCESCRHWVTGKPVLEERIPCPHFIHVILRVVGFIWFYALVLLWFIDFAVSEYIRIVSQGCASQGHLQRRDVKPGRGNLATWQRGNVATWRQVEMLWRRWPVQWFRQEKMKRTLKNLFISVFKLCFKPVSNQLSLQQKRFHRVHIDVERNTCQLFVNTFNWDAVIVWYCWTLV